MAIITLDNNVGAVGIPFTGTFTIDNTLAPTPYVLQLNSGALPPGLTSGLVTMKKMSQDAGGAGTGTQGEVVERNPLLPDGGKGILIFNQPYGTNGWAYIPLNPNPFLLGDTVYGQNAGADLGVVDAATAAVATYGARPTLPPTPPDPITALFDGVSWTITGVPTTAGVYNFELRVFNGAEQVFNGFNFTITILPAPADLLYFDHVDFPPTKINSNTPFNDELLGIWVGYDPVSKQICITNSSRSEVLYCLTIVPDVLDPKTLTYFDHSDASPAKINDPTVPFNNPTSDVWIGWDPVANKLCISNFDRTVLLGCADFSQPGGGPLVFFDNSNVIPSPQAVGVPFNNEPGNVWLAWDDANQQLCVTNYNRLTVICCFTLIGP